MRLLLGLLSTYLIGAIPTSYVIARLAGGIDLREHGSKNLGATNLYRVMGWKYALPAGAIDVAKGVIPVLVIAPWAGSAPWTPIVIGTTAVLGHVYSVFVGFRGGKGVATAAGAVGAIAPWALAAALGVWLLVVWITGYVSLGSILAAALFPFAAWLLYSGDPYPPVAGGVLALFIVFTHRSNIKRLIQGKESRFRHKQAAL